MGQPETGGKHRPGRGLAFHAPGVTLTKSPAATMNSAGIGAENRCLKFATAVGRRNGGKRGEDKTGTQLVRGLAGRCLGLYLWELEERSVRSIIGATLKRRDGSERVWLVFIGASGFSKFIDTDLLYSGFYPFFLVF